MMCLSKYKDHDQFSKMLSKITDLTLIQKHIIEVRYLSILHNFQKRSIRYSRMYFLGHFIITVGSLLVPAMLSIQYSTAGTDTEIDNTTTKIQVQIYWATWGISVLVTMCNALLTLFRIDKKYFFLNTTLERLRSEGWQYFGLTGRYSGHLINHKVPTYENQFIYFCHYIEKIKMKQVEIEYYKQDEKSAQAPAQPGINERKEMYVPSPDQPLNTIRDIPTTVQRAVNSIIRSTNTLVQPSNSDSSNSDSSHTGSSNGDLSDDEIDITKKNNPLTISLINKEYPI